MPRFSIVVPVYAVAEWLAACLDSITSQSYRDVEVLVVDDCSPDESGAIADERAAQDDRVRVLHLPANVGLGGARNAGMAEAVGDYLLFVDSDDELAPDALAAIAEHIDATDSPDVVLFGYARTYPDGREVPDPNLPLLARSGDWAPTDRPRLLKIIPTAWNKACRRDFLAEQGFAFPSGTYEDLPWSYPVLMAAPRLVTLDRACYLYRQRGTTNILSASGLVHLDLIRQYDRVFDYLDAHPQHELWRRPMVDRIAWHIPTVLETTSRIPPADRRRFFAACVAALRRHRPSGYRPAGRLGVKVLLLERGGYRVFRSAQLANQVRRRLSAATDPAGAARSTPRGGCALDDALELIRTDSGLDTAALAFDGVQVAAFHARLAELAARIEPAELDARQPPVTDEQRALLVLAARGRTGHLPLRRRTDRGRGLVRASCLYAGPVPDISVRVGGHPFRPEHTKTRSIDLVQRHVLDEWIAWVPLDATVEVAASDGLDGSVPVGTVARVRRVLRENTGVAGRLAADAALRARARTAAVRARYADAWVLMDRDSAAQDNAEHLYRHLRAHEPRINAWFALSRDSADWERLAAEGFRLIEYGSSEWFLALLHCRQLVSSQLDDYVVKPFAKHALGTPGWRYTFLQHGVLRHDLSRWMNRKSIDLFVTSTPDEQAAVAGDGPYVFTDLETRMVGLARHDRLLELAAAQPARDLLLVMPTWRDTLLGGRAVGNDRALLREFWQSRYAQGWSALLSSSRLQQLCVEHGWTLAFVPHPNMQDYLVEGALPPHVQAMRYRDIDIQSVLARAAAVVTDWSSLGNEAAYLERPVVYYQFDLDEFFRGGHFHRPGTWSYERDGFGPVTVTADAAVHALVRIAELGAPEPEYAQRMRAGFPLRDGRCCARTVAAIREIDN